MAVKKEKMAQNDTPTILFWGTSEFTVPSLQALLEAGFRVLGVVTTPDKPVGRKQLLTPPPIKVFAESKKIPVYQPETLKPVGYTLELPEADLFVVAAYGKIIPKNILEKPRLGALNIHPSLLPRWRGPSPIQFTILSGDTETGVTIIKMDELMDHGDIVANSKFEIRNPKITYPELHDELAKAGAKLLIETLSKWIREEITPVSQDESNVTFSKILKKEDGRINWEKPAQDIERQIRAFTPWPGSWTEWPRKDRPYRLRIDEALALDYEILDGGAGYISQTENYPLLVKTSKGSLSVTKLTIEGGKSMSANSFLKGHSDIISSSLV